MPPRKPLDLGSLDDKLLDGLKFCLKVYDLFDQVRPSPMGLEKSGCWIADEKRLLEELLPIAQYIQARYRTGNRLKIRWLSGSQSYDAIIWTPLSMAKHTNIPTPPAIRVSGPETGFEEMAVTCPSTRISLN